uniref:Capsid protein n=1 Tax=uncultured marine virus TaxID=186617 RepID=S4TFD4_9VIRU|nr:hypothetical protein [uncultured marine virus]
MYGVFNVTTFSKVRKFWDFRNIWYNLILNRIMPGLKRTYAMPYVPSGARMRANRLLAGAMRRQAKRTRTRGTYSANPHPAPSQAAVNSRSLKAVTYVQSNFRPSSAITQAGVPVDVVPRGALETQRLGHKWKVTALHLRGHIRIAQTAQDYANSGYYVVWDKQPNGVAAIWDNVFTGNSCPYSFPALSGDERFKIIHHRIFNLTYQGQALDANTNSQYVIDDYIKLPAGLVCCDTVGSQGTGAVADRQSGQLLLFPYSGKAAGADDRPNLNIAYRIYFDDV